MWAAANEDQWVQFYYGYRGRFEQSRRSAGRSTEAEWFVEMSDDSKIPLPSPEEMLKLQTELKNITKNFWLTALNRSE